ncbi:MAG: hypothetical protein CBARDCOR_1131 [uncultured Caballeronia sp.]|nr:MAG: hypothetical protein CBARDCOR_1131 [uncultured Caballeronia sp.]
MCGAGHNLRMILGKPRFFYAFMLALPEPGRSRVSLAIRPLAAKTNCSGSTRYALGDQTGSISRGSQLGASLAYVPAQGPMKVSASFLRSKDDDTDGKFDLFILLAVSLILGNSSLPRAISRTGAIIISPRSKMDRSVPLIWLVSD